MIRWKMNQMQIATVKLYGENLSQLNKQSDRAKSTTQVSEQLTISFFHTFEYCFKLAIEWHLLKNRRAFSVAVVVMFRFHSSDFHILNFHFTKYYLYWAKFKIVKVSKCRDLFLPYLCNGFLNQILIAQLLSLNTKLFHFIKMCE